MTNYGLDIDDDVAPARGSGGKGQSKTGILPLRPLTACYILMTSWVVPMIAMLGILMGISVFWTNKCFARLYYQLLYF